MKKFTTLCLALLAVLALFTVSSEQQLAYPCDVPNCATCSYLGFCGLCSNNYMLMRNSTSGAPYCAEVACNISNCQTCQWNNTCSQCASGFAVTNNGGCIATAAATFPLSCPTAKWCLSCATNTTCALCAYGYNLQANGLCYPNFGVMSLQEQVETNCQSAFTGYMCQLCKSGYIISPTYACVPAPTFNCSLANCSVCATASTCALCDSGFYTNAAG